MNSKQRRVFKRRNQSFRKALLSGKIRILQGAPIREHSLDLKKELGIIFMKQLGLT